MAIPETQLDTWAHQGSVTQSSNTYNTIKNTLEAPGTPYFNKNFKVILQGSYGNDTNIYAESDVDIVIQLNNCWHTDLESLSPDEKVAYEKSVVEANYGMSHFKDDVVKVLKAKYGNDVEAGDKAIAIAANGGRRKADVIAAIQYRRYYAFKGIDHPSFTEGMCFRNKNWELIANYPLLHSTNLTTKHQATNSWFKPVVRVLKNMRGRMVQDGIIKAGVAPSYYLEGLLYNVPAEKFNSSYGDCFVNAINWIQKDADKKEFVCANEQYYLLRDGYHTCWPTANGEAFLNGVVKLWNEWGKG